MKLKEALAKLESMGDEKRRAFNVKHGAGTMKHFGVATGDIRTLAKKIKTDHALALQLWKTGNIDAQLLAERRDDRNRSSFAYVHRRAAKAPLDRSRGSRHVWAIQRHDDTRCQAMTHEFHTNPRRA